MKILFLVPYPANESPSQRFRFEQYLPDLRAKGHQVIVRSFISSTDWKIFYEQGRLTKKMMIMISGTINRIFTLLQVPSCDCIFIHREAAPFGPPVFEWIIARVFKKPIVFDFDDAIWLPDQENETMLRKTIKSRGKIRSIISMSHRISAGNDYLKNFASQYNPACVLNPTTLDTEELYNPDRYPSPARVSEVKIVWTGSFSTLRYLESLESVLQTIQEKYPQVVCVVIADRSPRLNLKRMNFIAWSRQTEVSELLKCDIGIMPLSTDEWTKGKCGFKALQYMALKLPCVASPVGVNSKIIQSGSNGLLAGTNKEWIDQLSFLIERPLQREELGEKARKLSFAIIQLHPIQQIFSLCLNNSGSESFR